MSFTNHETMVRNDLLITECARLAAAFFFFFPGTSGDSPAATHARAERAKPLVGSLPTGMVAAATDEGKSRPMLR